MILPNVLVLVFAIIGLALVGAAVVQCARQLYVHTVYGVWLAHPLAQKVTVLEHLLEGKEKELERAYTTLKSQDEDIQKIWAKLLAR